ncbi:cytochrome P450 [Micromonospora humi]|uniref:Cytochrome P450 n=1 Tax=Micromonospora humi TaxID=745366 RepID=A0A1C5I507_9ACTN|nr:cytochrome P450 [Micromonospora humi]SCG53390.1 Cytochrome P450 [Micromonospora humi]
MASTDESHNYPLETAGGPSIHEQYRRLRQDDAMIRVRMPFGDDAWLATRYADVRCVHSDPRFSRAVASRSDQPRAFPVMPEENILGLDPPEHSRLRRLVSRVFTTRRVRVMRPLIQRVTDDLLDRMAAQGPPWDLVGDFGVPLTIGVIADLFGVPEADRPQFAEWSKAMTATTSMPPELARQHVQQLQEYVAELFAQRWSAPTDDLVGALIEGYQADSGVDQHEVVTLARLMLATGHGSVNYQFGHCAYLLLSHPDQLARLAAEPGLINLAVEELLRFAKTDEAAVFARYATRDVRLGGVLVRAGEPVLPSRISANHDETVFTDPERLDLTRARNPHLAFGYGPHHCPGAHLARAELQISLGSLVSRFPTLRLAVDPRAVPWESGGLAREISSLPVTW